MGKVSLIIMLVLLTVQLNADEWSQRHHIIGEVNELYESQQFTQLVKLFKGYTDNNEKMLDGTLKLTVFFESLAQVYHLKTTSDFFWGEQRRNAFKLIDSHPDNSLGYFIYAEVLMSQSELYEKYCFCKNTAAKRKKEYDRLIEEARIFLKQHEEQLNQHPRWYELMLIIAKYQQWDYKNFEELVIKSINKFPDYYPIYYAAVDYFSKVQGSQGKELDEFIQDIMFYNNSHDDELYARVYLYLVKQNKRNEPLHNITHLNWHRVKVPIARVIEKYPTQSNINHFARMACMAGDAKMTATLIKQIDQEIIRSIWIDEMFYLDCQQWANDLG